MSYESHRHGTYLQSPSVQECGFEYTTRDLAASTLLPRNLDPPGTLALKPETVRKSLCSGFRASTTRNPLTANDSGPVQHSEDICPLNRRQAQPCIGSYPCLVTCFSGFLQSLHKVQGYLECFGVCKISWCACNVVGNRAIEGSGSRV